jgi:hypothetical protein
MAHSASTFLDEVWAPMSDGDRAERRTGFAEIGERVTRVETKMDIQTGELALLRPIVHRMVSEVSALVLQGEQRQRDHGALMEQLQRFGDHLEQHDSRDDSRFAAHGSLLAGIGARLDAFEADKEGWAAWKRAIAPAVIAAGVTLATAILVLTVQHFSGMGVR